jgi:GFO/IDH/MocA oxidoreductase family protein
LNFAHVSVSSLFASGASAISRYTLIGTKGIVVADPAYEYAEALKFKLTIDGATTKREFPGRDQFAAKLTYFSDCVLNDKEPEPSGTEGLADLRIVQAIYESAKSGKFVRLPQFHKKLRPSTRQQIYRPVQEPPKKLMRHAEIATTMNVYGDSIWNRSAQPIAR